MHERQLPSGLWIRYDSHIDDEVSRREIADGIKRLGSSLGHEFPEDQVEELVNMTCLVGDKWKTQTGTEAIDMVINMYHAFFPGGTPSELVTMFAPGSPVMN